MGIVKGGILGTVTQKVANVVFQKWKSLNTVREKVDPANPQTPKQVFQRDRFSFITILGRLVNDLIIFPFWQYLATGFTTAWNEYFSTNIPLQPAFVDDVTPFVPDFAVVAMTEGLLEPAPLTGLQTYDEPSGAVQINFDTATIGNGLATDLVQCVVVDEVNGVAISSPSTGNVRTDGVIDFNVGSGRTFTDLHAYLFLHRGEGSEIEVSNAIYTALTEL